MLAKIERDVREVPRRVSRAVTLGIKGRWIKRDGVKILPEYIRLNRNKIRRDIEKKRNEKNRKSRIPIIIDPPVNNTIQCKHPVEVRQIPPVPLSKIGVLLGSWREYLLPNENPTKDKVLYMNTKVINGKVQQVSREVRVVSPSRIKPLNKSV